MDQPAGITSGPSTIISAAALKETHSALRAATRSNQRRQRQLALVSRYQALPAEMMVGVIDHP